MIWSGLIIPFTPMLRYYLSYFQWKPQGNGPSVPNGQNNIPFPGKAPNTAWLQPQQAKQPPIPFKPNGTAIDMAAKSQKLVMAQKQKLSEMNKKHVPLLNTLQTLDANKKSLES